MRNAFIEELTLLAEQNDRIFLMVGDLGFGVIENFERRFPNQFLNAGVAEQNMMGMAAGLASAGYQVYVYSIGNFPVFRCLEQIRNDICYEELDVSIVSIGAGLSYGTLGYSHHAIDDIGVVSALPGMTIYSPADPIETRCALRESVSLHTPKYFRLGKSGEQEIFNQTPTKFPNWTSLTFGNDLLILTTGAVTSEAIEAAVLLQNMGIEVSVVAIPVLKPLTFDRELVEQFDKVLVLEEHSKSGGLGTLLSEQLALNGIRTNLVKLGLPDQVHHELGSQRYLRSYFKLDAHGIVDKVKEMLKTNPLSQHH
jgi:transketolase